MIKKKYFLKDIEVTKELNGEQVTHVPNSCFTEESFIVLKLPTFGEKLKLQQQFKASEKDPEANYAMICSMVDEVHAVSLDSDDVITTFDDMTVYADGALVMEFITHMLLNGFVPKKRLTV